MQKSTLLFSITLLAMVFSQSQTFLTVDKTLWHGTIKFPLSMKSIPPIRIYYTGNKIPADVDNEGHQVSFTISEYKMRTTFYLIIVDQIDFVAEQNTVQYLRVPAGRPYKIYELTFKPNKEHISNAAETDIHQMGTWDIEQKKLADDMRIPDHAIIICYHANLVKSVEGGNAIDLPKVILDSELISKLTSEELHDASIQFLLSSLNCDSFHTLPDAQIKADFAKKTVIALTT